MSDSDDWHCDGSCGCRFKPTDMIDLIKRDGKNITSLCGFETVIDVLDTLVDDLTSDKEQWPDTYLHKQLCSLVAHCLEIPGMEKPLDVPAKALNAVFELMEVLKMSTVPMDEEKAPPPELLRMYDSEIMEALSTAAGHFTTALEQLFEQEKGKEQNEEMWQTSSEYPYGNVVDVAVEMLSIYDKLCKIYPEDDLSESAAVAEGPMEDLEDAVNAITEMMMECWLSKVDEQT